MMTNHVVLMEGGDILGSVLIIKNNYEIDLKLLKQLEKSDKIYMAVDAWEGLDIIDEHYIDIFVILSINPIEKSTWEFLSELYNSRSRITPIIFVAEQPSENLQSEINKNGNWYFIKYPLHHQDFISIIKNAMLIANVLDDKGFVLTKDGLPYAYQIKHISRIERNKHRYIKIYHRNPLSQIEETEEFPYKKSLDYFLEEYHLTKYIKQASQSWLVSVAEVKEIRTVNNKKELILTNGTVIPTSRIYLKNFQKKRTKK